MQIDKGALQADLLRIFRDHGLSVGVGITSTGVAIRSQDSRVDAKNLGSIKPYRKGTHEAPTD